MQPMQHQMMGYDRAITMFSPDGRLLQVEYALKTVKQGSTTVGMVCVDGIILVADRKIVNKLIIQEATQKIFSIDKHISIAASGILADARVLVDREQVKAQQHRIHYDSPIDIISVVKDISSLQQLTTQSGGLRPFGVGLLIAGIDRGEAKLYQLDPTATYSRYKAAAVGEAGTEIEETLKKEYKESLTMIEGIKLVIRAFNKIFDKGFSTDRVEAIKIPIKTAEMEIVDIGKLSKKK